MVFDTVPSMRAYYATEILSTIVIVIDLVLGK